MLPAIPLKELSDLTHSLRAWLALPAATLAAFSLLGLPSASQAQRPFSQSSSADSDLSAGQKSRIAARKARFEKDLAALHANTKLSDSQKQAKFQVLAQGADADLMAILTPDQRTQVLKRKAINVQFQKDLAALQTNSTMNDAQKKAKFESMLKARQEALLATLPPAQRARVVKEHDDKMARMASLRKQVETLGASIQKSESPGQLNQIKAISQSTRQQEKAVYDDRNLPEAVKATRIEALRSQARGKIDALLTPAQRVKFAHLRELVTSAAAQ